VTRYGHIFVGLLHRNDHESPDAEQRYSSSLSLTSAVDGGWMANATLRLLYAPETHYPLYRRLGRPPGLVWDGAENLTFRWGSIPGPSSPYLVAIPACSRVLWFSCLMQRQPTDVSEEAVYKTIWRHVHKNRNVNIVARNSTVDIIIDL